MSPTGLDRVDPGLLNGERQTGRRVLPLFDDHPGLGGSGRRRGRDDERDVKLVRRLLDDGRAREAGDPGGRPLPPAGPMEPDTLAAIRAFRAWSGADPAGRIEPGDLAWDALAAYHLAGVRDGRVRPDDLAFVPLRRPGDPSLSEADWREAFDVYLRLLRERL